MEDLPLAVNRDLIVFRCSGKVAIAVGVFGCAFEFEVDLLSAGAAGRELLSLKNRDLVRRAVAIVLHAIHARPGYRITGQKRALAGHQDQGPSRVLCRHSGHEQHALRRTRGTRDVRWEHAEDQRAKRANPSAIGRRPQQQSRVAGFLSEVSLTAARRVISDNEAASGSAAGLAEVLTQWCSGRVDATSKRRISSNVYP